MKQYGFTGKGTGKLGSAVFAISGGEQIVRQYNPVVANPQTEAQVAQRAKFKLLTQLAAAMSGQIAFRKSNLTSARNKFVAANMNAVSYSAAGDEPKATVVLSELDFTGGSLPLPQLSVDTETENQISVKLANAAAENIDTVVYFAYTKDGFNKVSLIGQTMVSDAGSNRTFDGVINGQNNDKIVIAYGISFANSAAKAKFDNYYLNSVDTNAFVSVFKKMSVTDYRLTVTQVDV